MKRLFFVRHGETEHNVKRLWSGQSESSLTEKGKDQAKQAGQNAKLSLPRIDLMICSPYERTYHTASIIAEEIDYPIKDIQKNHLFVERAFGSLEGTSNPGFYETHTIKDVDDMNGSETIAELHARAEKALRYLETLTDYDNVLVVSHGSFGRALRRVVNNMPHSDEYIEERRASLRIANAEIVELL